MFWVHQKYFEKYDFFFCPEFGFRGVLLQSLLNSIQFLLTITSFYRINIFGKCKKNGLNLNGFAGLHLYQTS